MRDKRSEKTPPSVTSSDIERRRRKKRDSGKKACCCTDIHLPPTGRQKKGTPAGKTLQETANKSDESELTTAKLKWGDILKQEKSLISIACEPNPKEGERRKGERANTRKLRGSSPHVKKGSEKKRGNRTYVHRARLGGQKEKRKKRAKRALDGLHGSNQHHP